MGAGKVYWRLTVVIHNEKGDLMNSLAGEHHTPTTYLSLVLLSLLMGVSTLVGCSPRSISNSVEQEPDLIPERRPGASGEEGFCRLSEEALVVRVRNQTNTDVLTPTVTRVVFSPGGEVSQPTPAIPGGSMAEVSFAIPAGCFNPDCDFTISVDADNQIDESHGGGADNHETNNIERGTCIG